MNENGERSRQGTRIEGGVRDAFLLENPLGRVDQAVTGFLGFFLGASGHRWIIDSRRS